MKYKIIFLLFSFSSLFAELSSSDKFLQEIVTIFTSQLMDYPKAVYSEIRFDDSENIIVSSNGQEYIYDHIKWKPMDHSSDNPDKNRKLSNTGVFSELEYQSRLYRGKDDGLFLQAEQENEWIEVFPSDENYSWKLSNVKVLQVDFKNRLWFGSNEGVGYLTNDKWKLFTGKEGLPFKHFTSIANAPNGEVWFGTKKGAIRADGEKFYYRFSRRWLPDDHVNDILVEKDGTVWLATNRGVSRISFQSMSLEEKAERFTEQVELRHNRMGFIAQNRLKDRFDANSWEPAISDNDGMYTAMYGASQAFRYAVTGNA